MHAAARERHAADAPAAREDAAAVAHVLGVATRGDQAILDEARLHIDARAHVPGGREHAVGDTEARQRRVG